MIDCKAIAAKIKEELKPLVSEDKGLAIIQVGNNPASEIYVRNKMKDCAELGVPCYLYRFTEKDTINDVLCKIAELNYQKNIKGIICQLPLPDGFDTEKITNAIIDEKDVDGFKVTSKYTPATPRGVMTILDSLGIDLAGKKVCLVGKGKTVGMPLIPLLLERGVTLTVCHSRTDKFDLEDIVFDSDIIISAVGKQNTITAKMLGLDVNQCRENNFKQTTRIIIDVGISRDNNGKQIGDCEKELHNIVDKVTPFVGGVGLMTRVSLLQNLLEE